MALRFLPLLTFWLLTIENFSLTISKKWTRQRMNHNWFINWLSLNDVSCYHSSCLTVVSLRYFSIFAADIPKVSSWNNFKALSSAVLCAWWITWLSQGILPSISDCIVSSKVLITVAFTSLHFLETKLSQIPSAFTTVPGLFSSAT